MGPTRPLFVYDRSLNKTNVAEMIKVQMERLGLEPGAAVWYAQTNPRSNNRILLSYKAGKYTE